MSSSDGPPAEVVVDSQSLGHVGRDGDLPGRAGGPPCFPL